MRALLLFYSRTGTTRCLATEIATGLKADLEELQDQRDWRGVIGALKAVWSELVAGRSLLTPITVDLSAYGLVIIGTPVWASRPSVPVRTFLEDHKAQLPNVAFFCTEGGHGGNAVMRQMSLLSNKTPVSTLVISDADRKSERAKEKQREFLGMLRRFISEPGRLYTVS